MFDFAHQIHEILLTRRLPEDIVLRCGWLLVDIDTFAIASSRRSRRVWVEPALISMVAARWLRIFFSERVLLEAGTVTEREGISPGDGVNLERLIRMADRLSATGSKEHLPARLDPGFDSAAIVSELRGLGQLTSSHA